MTEVGMEVRVGTGKGKDGSGALVRGDLDVSRVERKGRVGFDAESYVPKPSKLLTFPVVKFWVGVRFTVHPSSFVHLQIGGSSGG